MLPHQLAPYHQYSIASMLMALVLLCDMRQHQNATYESAAFDLAPEGRLTPFAFRRWLDTTRQAVARAYPLCATEALSNDISNDPWGSCVAMIKAMLPRGPPCITIACAKMVKRYSSLMGCHFLGTPFQERRRGVRFGT